MERNGSDELRLQLDLSKLPESKGKKGEKRDPSHSLDASASMGGSSLGDLHAAEAVGVSGCLAVAVHACILTQAPPEPAPAAAAKNAKRPAGKPLEGRNLYVKARCRSQEERSGLARGALWSDGVTLNAHWGNEVLPLFGVEDLSRDLLELDVWEKRASGGDAFCGDVQIPLVAMAGLRSEENRVAEYILRGAEDAETGRITLEFQFERDETAKAQQPETSARQRGVKRGDKVVVEVVEGRNLAPKDANGLSDPYCTISCGADELGRTEIRRRTLKPTWNYEVSFAVPDPRGVLVVTIFDWDAVTASDYMGEVAVSLAALQRDGEPWDHWFPVSSSKAGERVTGELHLRFRVEPRAARRMRFSADTEEHEAGANGASARVPRSASRMVEVGELRQQVRDLEEALAHKTGMLAQRDRELRELRQRVAAEASRAEASMAAAAGDMKSRIRQLFDAGKQAAQYDFDQKRGKLEEEAETARAVAARGEEQRAALRVELDRARQSARRFATDLQRAAAHIADQAALIGDLRAAVARHLMSEASREANAALEAEALGTPEKLRPPPAPRGRRARPQSALERKQSPPSLRLALLGDFGRSPRRGGGSGGRCTLCGSARHLTPDCDVF